MRILVLGAGGTGGYFGGRAFQAGADVSFLLRPARAQALREQGLRIRSPRGDATLHPTIVTADQLEGSYDLVLLSCKAYDLDSAIEAIMPAVGSQTAVLPIMNGVLQYDVLDRVFGAQRVLGGLCQINASLGTQGEVLHLGPAASLIFGERTGLPRSERCVALEAVLSDAAFSSRLSEQIYQDIWEKFVFLSSLAAASGYAVRPEADALAVKVLTDPAQPMTASMFRDLRQGLRVEADHIVGDMARRGAALGVATPLMRLAYTNLQVYQATREDA